MSTLYANGTTICIEFFFERGLIKLKNFAKTLEKRGSLRYNIVNKLTIKKLTKGGA